MGFLIDFPVLNCPFSIGYGAMEQRCCKVRGELAAQFATAARLYAEAVVVLTSSFSSNSHLKYEQLVERAHEVQRRSDLARIAFEEHVGRHRCDEIAFAAKVK